MNKVVIANWKQNLSLTEVQDWLSKFNKLVGDFDTNLDVLVASSHPYLGVVEAFAKKYDWLHTCAQDLSATENGTHTGEVGAAQIKDFAKYCIVGHSEREEDREVVEAKIEQCFANGITPIICFVEPEKLEYLKRDNAILLWEDPGNISQGGVFNPKDTKEIEQGIKEIKEKYDVKEGLIYGGSITRNNASELGDINELDGGISGGASLDPEHFFDIVKGFSK